MYICGEMLRCLYRPFKLNKNSKLRRQTVSCLNTYSGKMNKLRTQSTLHCRAVRKDTLNFLRAQSSEILALNWRMSERV